MFPNILDGMHGHATRVDGPLVWSGSRINSTKSYVMTLSESDIAEMKTALVAFKASNRHVDDISTANFALPKLGPKLKNWARTLYDGMGFFIIRGLDAEEFSAEDNLAMYIGVSCYIGDERGVQDGDGNMIAHVIEAKMWKDIPAEARHGIHQAKSMPFHTDMPAEILALHVLQCAEEGGHTYVSSGWTVYNELLSCHPEELRILMTPNWPIQVSVKNNRHIKCPLIDFKNGKVFVCLDPGRLGPHPKSGAGRVPNLKPSQIHALGVLMKVAARHRLSLESQPGDMVFVNNFALLHAREAYKDAHDSPRHLVRLWLRNTSQALAIPDAMKTPWMSAFQPTKVFLERKYPAKPSDQYQFPCYAVGSAAFVMEDDGSEDEHDEEGVASSSQAATIES